MNLQIKILPLLSFLRVTAPDRLRVALIPQRLSRLQHRRDPLLSFPLAAQRYKCFAFEIDQVLFRNICLVIQSYRRS